MEKVSVQRGLLVGLVALSGGSLLAVAFLLGRVSRAGAPAPAAPPAPRAPEQVGQGAPGAPAEPGPPAAQQPSRETAPAVPSAERPVQAAAPPAVPFEPRIPRAATPPVAAPRAAPGVDPAAAEVASYLGAVESLQPGSASENAESTANEMAAALAKGDTTSLDKMIRQTEAAKVRLAALVPPASCAAHHQESLGALDDALDMLRSVKKALAAPEPAAEFAAVSTRAAALRSRSEALQNEEQALRQRYGLAR